MSGSLEFRPLRSDADWELATAFRNGCDPSQPLTCDEARHAAEGRAKHGYSEIGLFYAGGEAVGQGGAIKAYWTSEEAYFVYACPRREPDATPRYAEMLRLAEGLAAAQGATRFQTHGRSDLPWTVHVPPTLGYRVTQSNRALRLDLGACEPQGPPTLSSPRSGTPGEGSFEILSYPELAARRPDTWEREVWRLEMDLMADVPLPEPWQDIPFERFLAQLHSPHAHLDARFAALAGEGLMGLTLLMPNNADPTIASTGLTGVRREHRRKGVARALKLHALRWARERGLRRLYTDTEDANPMGALNLELGFVYDHDLILMAR